MTIKNLSFPIDTRSVRANISRLRTKNRKPPVMIKAHSASTMEAVYGVVDAIR